MWENPKDKNDEKYGSLRNILKNFDPYAVLEPLTPQGIPKENILVDLSVKSANNDSNLELSGSLLDKSTKSDFEVIDVFQNLYVTPQHVTNKNINDNKDWIKAFDIEHKNIEIDMKKELENIFTVKKTKLNATLTRLSDDEFDVDEIDEVLRIKRIKKLIKTQQNASSSNFESRSNNTGTTQNTYIKTNNLQDNIIIKIDKQENIRTINNIVKKKLNNFDIKTVKLDKKKLQKKIVLPDDVKRNYTKGPDLLEKSIALPSMIERIKERQQMINNEKCLRHRLVLEPDNLIISNDKTLYKFNPEALTEDCNKERLTALHGGRAFERFVTGEK
ncbi:PREDICTED: uncharacterized protein LOC106114752 [Papilio xuthus]|uniref:Uncharacterized protein LOC106114752 n=1 Tax=Papilio xuthus TaxID=66420 RepID=A0AAJ6Z265_PAPXU|nr:PREDICTED: uncharacterized protein LOC106114752 [Papilio xuthus]XP_013163525.1 PREDICTED: uncharacterized protein LOC106114752 [Papilio xuthus]